MPSSRSAAAAAGEEVVGRRTVLSSADTRSPSSRCHATSSCLCPGLFFALVEFALFWPAGVILSARWCYQKGFSAHPPALGAPRRVSTCIWYALVASSICLGIDFSPLRMVFRGFLGESQRAGFLRRIRLLLNLKSVLALFQILIISRNV